ncbi:LysR family substrate-binding domain-containing protein [Kribbella kalugense]|uniref:LysR substrate binding domain-containing protein n=1 Tax=Kribbella kalugense TaxID=2512221 RepID=A0A4R7ZUF9_9ACTN|nr:LysR family substrate-binding domain-containing protein [Kribbella kalugense]TDW21733.1 LysR substrate binding domain-containing protein [Kribbella kalugense]
MTGFRLGYVPGVTPAKWARIWAERLPRVPLELIQVTAAEAPDLVRRSEVDTALLRLPIDRDGLHAIPLYVEQTVVVVPKDHLVTAADEVTVDDLADELMLHPQDDVLDWDRPPGRLIDERPPTTTEAVALVAMGTGLLVVPQSLARLHHRKDLTYRPLTDAPESQVALVWPEGEPSNLMEQFIGIVRGRTANSTRGTAPTPEKKPDKKPAKKTPVKKTGKQPPTGRRKPTRRR